MFESAEIGHSIGRKEYEEALPALLEGLLDAQYALKEQARFPVIVLINGIEGAGKGETVKLLNEWMDPRLIQVETFDVQTDEELARPPEWRYWRRLPPKGRTGVFFGNWYSQMLQARVAGEIKDAGLEQAIDAAQRFERMLCDEGALIFKFWFHLSKKQMKTRLKALAEDPLRSWRITPLDWQQSKTYDKFVRHGEHMLCQTSRVHHRRQRPELPRADRGPVAARGPAGRVACARHQGRAAACGDHRRQPRRAPVAGEPEHAPDAGE